MCDGRSVRCASIREQRGEQETYPAGRKGSAKTIDVSNGSIEVFKAVLLTFEAMPAIVTSRFSASRAVPLLETQSDAMR
jgi:hypothetical protein